MFLSKYILRVLTVQNEMRHPFLSKETFSFQNLLWFCVQINFPKTQNSYLLSGVFRHFNIPISQHSEALGYIYIYYYIP